MLTCVIIDDEPKAIQLLELYCDRLSDINVLESFRDPIKGLSFIKKSKPDMVFLDINMPHIKGNELARILPKKLKIIFTTAYSEFAAESYEIGALDYLLKPISFERFLSCIGKIKSTISLPETETKFVIVKSGTTSHRLEVSEINYLQKDGNYSFYHLNDKKIMARESVAESLAKLPNHFIQIHKSYIVNLNKISSFGVDFVQVGKKMLPVSEKFKEQVYKRL